MPPEGSRNKRGFFDFLGFSNTRSNTELPQPNGQTESRRSFLKKMGIGAGALASGVFVPDVMHVLGAEREAKSLKDFEQEILTKIQPEGLQEIYELSYEQRTLEEQDRLYQWFVSQYPYETLQGTIAQAIENGNIKDLYRFLSNFDAHGHVYHFLQEHPDDKHNNGVMEFLTENTQGDYYRMRAIDYLPIVKEMRDQDIDPRDASRILELQNQIDAGTKYQIDKSIREEPGWTSQKRHNIFKELLENESLRKMFTSDSTLTIAEVFSLIKALYKTQQLRPHTTQKEIIQELLDRRTIFLEKEIVGSDTDSFVYIYDPSFEDEASNIKDKIREISDGHANFTNISDDSDTNPKQTLCSDVIPNSSGKTVLYFNVHGNSEYVRMSNNPDILEDERILKLKDLSYALIARLEKHKDQYGQIHMKEFENMAILFDACSSYNLIESNLVQHIKEAYDKKSREGIFTQPIGDLILPTIITSSQEGSMSLEKRGFFNAFKRHKPANQPITGAYLLRRIQPEMYPYSDMTVFQGDAGELIEIGKHEQQNEQRMVA